MTMMATMATAMTDCEKPALVVKTWQQQPVVILCGRHSCGHHYHHLWPSLLWPSLTIVWPSLFVAVTVVFIIVMICGLHCLWPSLSWFVAVTVCGRHSCGHHCHDLWPSLFVAVVVMVCGRHCCTSLILC